MQSSDNFRILIVCATFVFLSTDFLLMFFFSLILKIFLFTMPISMNGSLKSRRFNVMPGHTPFSLTTLRARAEPTWSMFE